MIARASGAIDSRSVITMREHEAPHTLVASAEAVAVDRILPDPIGFPPRSCAIISRQGSQRLEGPQPGFLASESVIRLMAGFEFSLPQSVIGLMDAFAGPWRPHPPGGEARSRCPEDTRPPSLDAPQSLARCAAKTTQDNDLFSLF